MDKTLGTTTKSPEGWGAFIRLIRQTNPPVLRLSVALLTSVSATLFGLVIPLFAKNMIDHFSLTSLNPAQIAGFVAVFVVQAIAGALSVYWLSHVGQTVVARLRDRLWKKLLVLPVSYYDRHLTGETISRMTNDTGVVKGLITEHMSHFFTGIISMVGSIAVLLYLDWKMTLMMLAMIPLSVLILRPLGIQMRKISKDLQDETASFTAVLTQVLSEVRLVKSFNAEPIEYRKGNDGILNLFRFGLKEGKVQALISPLISLVVMMLLVAIIGYGGMRVSSGSLSAGTMVAFILYLFQIVMPMGQLVQFFAQLQKARGATERIVSTLEQDEEDHESGNIVPPSDKAIRFEQVSFAYKEGENVLDRVSFTMEPGKVTAIVGPSGAGKTTLFSLLERFYDPTEGRILLGTESMERFSFRSWREQIGYVSQESPLIAGTIRDNICYGAAGPVRPEEMERAAKMAYADAFIREFPQGYDAEVGERGVKFSGGQRQRIAIARALLRNPRILMLDEATSSLDSQSEEIVQKALGNLMSGRTTVVIAHRLSTVVGADLILFMEKGKITGSGTHDELMQSHALYREFAVRQLQIKEPVKIGNRKVGEWK